MRARQKAAGRATLARTGHAHRWRIEEPNGPTVQGVCRVCGEERTFPTTDSADGDWRGTNGTIAGWR